MISVSRSSENLIKNPRAKHGSDASWAKRKSSTKRRMLTNSHSQSSLYIARDITMPANVSGRIYPPHRGDYPCVRYLAIASSIKPCNRLSEQCHGPTNTARLSSSNARRSRRLSLLSPRRHLPLPYLDLLFVHECSESQQQ